MKLTVDHYFINQTRELDPFQVREKGESKNDINVERTISFCERDCEH